MVDTKLKDLTAISAVAGEDLFYALDDPAGTPLDRKATITQLATFLDANSATLTNKTINTASNTITVVEADISDLQAYITDITGENLSTLADVTITTIGANEILKWNGSAWINNTLAEAGISATGHSHTESDISDLGTLAAMVADNLSVFAATTSAQLAGVISDETGSGALVFGTSPTIVTPTIASFENATHDHLNNAGGGQITEAAISDLQSYWLDASVNTGTNKTFNDFTNFLAADEIHSQVYAAVTVAKGDAVYISGFNVGAGLPEVSIADSSAAATMPAYGIANEAITATNTGEVIVAGEISGIDTSAVTSEGDPLYISNVGTTGNTLTATKPTGTDLIQKIGTVTRDNISVGVLEVLGAGRSNDLPNIANTKIWIGDASGVPQEFALSGDVTMTAGGVVTVADNSHSHTESNISDLGTTVAMVADNLSVFAATTSAQLLGVISDETGTGSLVFATSPTLVTPALGTPASGVLTNCTGLPLTTGVTGILPSANLDADTAHLSTSQTFTGKKTFTATVSGDAGLNVGSDTGAPTTNLANGDIYYNTTDNKLYGRINTAWVDLGQSGAEVTTWTADHDAAGFDLLNVGGIQINNPADTFQYIITPAAIAADRILNLPLMTGTDTFVLNDFAATLTNKTIALGSNTVSGTAAEFDTAVTDDNFMFDNATNVVTGAIQVTGGTMRIPLSATPTMAVDGDFAVDTTITDFSMGLIKYYDGEEMAVVALPVAQLTTPTDGAVVTYNATNDEFDLQVPAGSGDMILASAQTNSGIKTFLDTTMKLRNVANTFDGYFVNTNTADRIYTLPDEAGTISLIGRTETLTGKTLTTPTIASFTNATHDHADAAGGGQILSTTALSDTANIAYLNTANSYTAGTKQSFLADATTAGLNINNQVPSTTIGGDIWRSTDALTYRNNADTADLVLATLTDISGKFDTAGTGLTSSGTTVNVIGTASRITANANDIDIASDYVGQTSITTLGTIGTGTWQGTAIASAFLDADTAHLTTSQTFTGKKTFTATAAGDAGINVGSDTGAPTTNLANGDVYYNTTDNKLYGRINTAWVDLGQSGAEVTTWTADHDTGGNSLTFTTDATPPAGTAQTIYSDADGIVVNVPTGDDLTVSINNVDEYILGASTLDLNGNSITLFSTNKIISADSSVMDFAIPVGDTFTWTIAAANEMTLSATALTLAAGNNLVLQASGATGFMDIGEITTPANPSANVGRLYVKDDATTTKLYFRDSAGTETDLLAGGGNHNLLSSTHPDTTTGSPARGDLITGQTASPVWQKLAIGGANTVLKSDGTDAAWSALTIGTEVTGASTALTDTANIVYVSDNITALTATTKANFDAEVTDGTFAFENDANIFTANQEIGLSNATATLILDANHTTAADGNTIGQIDFFDTTTVAPAEQQFAQIRAVIQDPANASYSAELMLGVAENAGAIVDYIVLNEADGNDVTIKKNLDLGGNTLTNLTDITSITNLNGVAIGNYILTTDNSTSLADTANICYLNTANDFGDFAQTFKDNQLKIENPAGTFDYIITAGAIAAERILNLPVLTGTDTLMTLGLDQTVTGTLTLTTPVLGTPTSGTLTNCTGLPFSGIATGTKADLEGRLSDVTDLAEADGDTYTGAHLFNGATMRIPLSATPTMAVDGDFAIDTDLGASWSMGLPKYYDGEEMVIVAVPVAQTTAPTDGHILSYNGTNNEFELKAAGAADNLGNHTATQDLNMAGFDIDSADSIYVDEKAAATADVAGDGQFWVRNDTTQSAMFTDEAGTDQRINQKATIQFVIDGGGSTITTGVKGDLEIPNNFEIERVTMLADQSGSIVVDIWEDTYANYPPTDADSITASAVPTISTATKSQDSTLTGWTTAIIGGSTLRYNVDSVTTIQRVVVSLWGHWT